MSRLSDKNKTLTTVSAPQSPDQAGFIAESADGTVPNGWLECNGQPLSTTEYPELFAAIGYTYGGSGGTFNLPGGSQLTNANVTGTLDASGTITGGSLTDGTAIINAGAISGVTTITASGDMNIDSNTLFVDSSANSVGMGTAIPSEKLEVNGALRLRKRTLGSRVGAGNLDIDISFLGLVSTRQDLYQTVILETAGGQDQNNYANSIWLVTLSSDTVIQANLLHHYDPQNSINMTLSHPSRDILRVNFSGSVGSTNFCRLIARLT